MKIITTVKKINYRKQGNTFTVFTGKINKATQSTLSKSGLETTLEMKFIGHFLSISIDDQIEIDGEFEWNAKYGEPQINCKGYKRILPHTSKALIEYIHKKTKLGKKSAEKVVQELGSNCLNLISENHKVLLSIKGVKIKEQRAQKISNIIQTNIKYEEIIATLSSYKIPYYIAISIAEYIKADFSVLKKNPYNISHIASLSIMDKIAKKFNTPFDAPIRIQTIILEYLKWSQKFKGHLFVYIDDLLNEINPYITRTIKSIYEQWITPELIKKEIVSLIEDGRIFQEGDAVYLKYNYKTEKIIVEQIKRHLNANKINTPFTDNDLDQMASEQIQAIKTALKSNISILGGGPGTGKTFTLSKIIQSVKNTNPNAIIQLGAPTGKAAKRITESTGMPAQTLHRMLGLGSNYLEEDANEIICDFIIVDESSMIDAYLFLRMLESIPEHCKILLVGDFQQLPSVGAGNVLECLIDSEVIPVVELKKIFRQGADSDIIVNSHSLINNKDINIDNKKDFHFYEESSNEKINEKIMKTIETLISRGNSISTDIQILSPMKKGIIGTLQLNKQIQDRFNKNTKSIDFGDFVIKKDDKVIQTENNYDLEVFNGEVGIVTQVNDFGDAQFEIIVDFGDKEIIFNEKNSRKLELAYAMTIHKSQGSEFPIVIIPISSSHNIMLNKNLIYTGWTRAKSLLINFGEIERLSYAQTKKAEIVRNSKLKERLVQKNT